MSEVLLGRAADKGPGRRALGAGTVLRDVLGRDEWREYAGPVPVPVSSPVAARDAVAAA